MEIEIEINRAFRVRLNYACCFSARSHDTVNARSTFWSVVSQVGSI